MSKTSPDFHFCIRRSDIPAFSVNPEADIQYALDLMRPLMKDGGISIEVDEMILHVSHVSYPDFPDFMIQLGGPAESRSEFAGIVPQASINENRRDILGFYLGWNLEHLNLANRIFDNLVESEFFIVPEGDLSQPGTRTFFPTADNAVQNLIVGKKGDGMTWEEVQDKSLSVKGAHLLEKMRPEMSDLEFKMLTNKGP